MSFATALVFGENQRNASKRYPIQQREKTMNQQQASNTPKSQRDLWQTPQWLYDYLDHYHRFEIDLACNESNCKAEIGYFVDHFDALEEEWHKRAKRGFCNPPYSKIKPWLKKAYEESLRGFTSVFVIPTPNGESAYGEWVFGKASEIVFINGRVGFERPDGTAVGSNTRGTCIVIYRPPVFGGGTFLNWADREKMKKFINLLNNLENDNG